MGKLESAGTDASGADLGVAALALGAFVFVTTENLPVGLLPQIATGLGVSPSAAGLLVTGYAGAVVLSAVPMTGLTATWERRRLLIALLATMAAADLVGALAPSFAVMLGARLLCGVAHGIFWSIIAPLAGRLMPGRGQSRATSLVFTGISLAMVAGIPLGTLLGEQAGWRVAFLAAGGLATLTLLAVALAVPRLPALAVAETRSFADLIGRRRLRAVVVATALVYVAHFAAFTYVTVFVHDVTGISTGAIGPLLLLYGAAGLAGTLLAGKAGERSLEGACRGGALLLATVLLGLAVAGAITPLMALLVAGWGAAIAGLSVVLQSGVLRLAPDAPDAASAIYVVAANLGIGGGALLGSALLPALGLRGLAAVAGALALAAAVVLRPQPD
jgi:predicted MFS family arabinose efflux permease